MSFTTREPNTTMAPSENFKSNQSAFVMCTFFPPDSETVRIIKIVALCLIMALAIVGNILIIIVISKTKILRRTVNLFILNMAVSDVIMPTLLMPQELITVITGSNDWRVPGVAGELLCKMVIFLGDSSSAVSVLSMVCIAVDRFCAVVLPMKRNLVTGKLRTVALTMTWVLAFMYTSPNLYTARLQKYGTSYKCLTVWAPLDHYTSATVHVVVMVVLFMFIPWLLVATLYLVMVSEIRKSKREVAQRSRQRNRDLRVLKLALTITAAFAVCNFPICALYLLIAFKYQWNTCFLPEVWGPLFNTAKYLVLASTCLNPCICFAFSENFRKGLRELTRAQRSFITTIVTHSRRANSTAFSHIEGEHEMLYEMKENGITENGNKNAIDYSPSQSLRE